MINHSYIFSLIILVMFPFAMVQSQEQSTLRERAEAHFLRYEYAEAVALFTRLADRSSPRLQDLERVADSYFHMRDFDQAAEWYRRIVSHKDHQDIHVLHYANALKASGQYQEAKNQYQAYLDRAGVDELVSIQMAGCDSAMVWRSNPSAFQLRNEREINTSGSEFAVAMINQEIYYAGEPQSTSRSVKGTYGWTGRPYLKVYRANIGEPMHLAEPQIWSSEINDPLYHVGPIASPDGGRTYYVTRTFSGDSPAIEREHGRKFKTRKLELHVYENIDNQWSTRSFAYNNPAEFSVGHATFTRDGQLMYFVSDKPGGFGGTDIWFCSKNPDGTWEEPQNAGPNINTPGNELFPVIGVDGSLFYSTDGLPGMGGLDIFHAKGAQASWTKPVNVGYPLNSPADDFSLLLVQDDSERQWGYLASNRPGGQGNDDIYAFSFEKPQPIVLVLQGIVSDKNTATRLPDARVVLEDSNGNKLGERRTQSDGTFEFMLDPEQAYSLSGSLAKYQPDSAEVNTFGMIRSDTLQVALALEREYEVGETFVLENLYYDFDKHNIRPDAAEVLDGLVDIMTRHPTLKIELSSHTDSRGSHAYNQALSQRRAQAAVDYLVSKGISRGRMIAQGYGETKLVNQCQDGVDCSEEQHQANRRTEVTILEK